MTAPSTRLAYGAEFELLERALNDPSGIRVRVKTLAEAYTLRGRCHFARKVDRRDNSFSEAEGSELYGRSAYDPLVVRIREDTEGNHWVYIQRSTLEGKHIESLSETVEAEFTEIQQIESEPVKQIENKIRRV